MLVLVGVIFVDFNNSYSWRPKNNKMGAYYWQHLPAPQYMLLLLEFTEEPVHVFYADVTTPHAVVFLSD